MAEEGLDVLVVRAPDNVLYLSNFWGMKGYEAVVFPREGEPALVCLEASAEDAGRMAWTEDAPDLRGSAAEGPPAPGAACPPGTRACNVRADGRAGGRGGGGVGDGGAGAQPRHPGRR